MLAEFAFLLIGCTGNTLYLHFATITHLRMHPTVTEPALKPTLTQEQALARQLPAASRGKRILPKNTARRHQARPCPSSPSHARPSPNPHAFFINFSAKFHLPAYLRAIFAA